MIHKLYFALMGKIINEKQLITPVLELSSFMPTPVNCNIKVIIPVA